MMQIIHPRVLDDDAGPPPSSVDVRGETVPIGEDGSFEIDDQTWLQQFASRYGVDVDELVDGDQDADADEEDVDEGDVGDEANVDENADAPETCQEVKSDGEKCGRELPCRYHSDDEDTEE